MERLQPLARDVGVDLGGRDVGVPEEQLHDAPVGRSVEEMGGERVPQRVRRQMLPAEFGSRPARGVSVPARPIQQLVARIAGVPTYSGQAPTFEGSFSRPESGRCRQHWDAVASTRIGLVVSAHAVTIDLITFALNALC